MHSSIIDVWWWVITLNYAWYESQIFCDCSEPSYYYCILNINTCTGSNNEQHTTIYHVPPLIKEINKEIVVTVAYGSCYYSTIITDNSNNIISSMNDRKQ